MSFDPGMDKPPAEWASPEFDPGFAEVPPHVPAPENDADPYGSVHFADAGEMQRETMDAIRKTNAALARIIDHLGMVGWEIIDILAGATMSQRIRLRVQALIIDRDTAGSAVLTVGTRSYAFTVNNVPTYLPFPLVIERGVDVGFTGDGRVYILGIPE